MKILQRMMLIVSMAVFLIQGINIWYRAKEERLWQQWETFQAECFLKELSCYGNNPEEAYLVCCAALNTGGVTSEIKMEEYEMGNRTGEEWCVIRLEVLRQSSSQETRNIYYDIIREKNK